MVSDGITDADISECEKYISTRNADMENIMREIINLEIENKKEKNIIISIKEIVVLNLSGRSEGGIYLDYSEEFDYKTEKEFIGNMAEKLFEKYPDDFSENSIRDSWVDVSLIADMVGRLVMDIRV